MSVDSVIDWLAGKDLDDLEVVESGGRNLYRESLKKRDLKTGALREKPVFVRVPNSRDKALGRLDALRWTTDFAKAAGVTAPSPMTRAVALSLIGPEQFDELENKAILARCIRELEPPHAQYLRYDILDDTHDHSSLIELWDRLSFYLSVEDCRVSDLGEDELLDVVMSIAERRNLSPLVAIAGRARDGCIVSMAVRLSSFLTPKSSLPSAATSTPEPSSPSSSPSSSPAP